MTIFLSPWSIPVLAGCVSALVLFAVIRSARENRNVKIGKQVAPVVLRLVAIGILFWLALNPTAMLPREEKGKPKLAVLLDSSYSMSVKDVGGKSRFDSAVEAILTAEPSLAEELDLDVKCFDKEITPVDLKKLPEADGVASDIAASISGVVNELDGAGNIAGVVLVSDGRSTAGEPLEAAQLALAKSFPFWTISLGGEVARRDIWMETASNEMLAFAGDDVELTASLHQVGYENRSFAVEILSEGKVVEKRDVTPDDTGTALVRFSTKSPAQGESRYIFRAVADSEEAEKQNNERSVFVRSVGNKVRVLVAEGRPHWDTKFLVQSLKRNLRVDLTAVYRITKDRQFAVVSSGGEQRRESKDLFPRTPEEFLKYDVIIMGRGCEAFFDDKTEELLTFFVAKQGGGLIFARGKGYGSRFQPLSKLEPVIWGAGSVSRVKLAACSQARNTPLFEITTGAEELDDLVGKLPLFDQATCTVGVKPLAVPLATSDEGGEDSPVLMAYHLYGQGRVLSVNAGGLWRWSFREKRGDADDAIYGKFWLGVIRWMLSGSDFLAGHDVALSCDRRMYTDEQKIQLLVQSRGLEAYHPNLTITGPGGVSKIEPQPRQGGVFVSTIGPFEPGVYNIDLHSNVGQPSKLSMSVQVVTGSIESRMLSADPQMMKKIAEVTEGAVLTLADLPKLGDIYRRWQADRQLADRKVPLWDHWWILAALLGVFGMEWFLRRREGLL